MRNPAGSEDCRRLSEKTSVKTGHVGRMERNAFHDPYLSIIIVRTPFHRHPMKTIAYLGVPAPQQDAGSRRLAILEHARKQGFNIDDFAWATASGTVAESRRRLDGLMDILARGDRLIVSELSRLGRSLGHVVTVLDNLARAGVAFVAIKENIRIEGKQDIQTGVMTALFALNAEVERDLISERTREGLARARASGKKPGRPKGALGVSRLDGREEEIRQFLKLGVSRTAIARITGVSRSTLYNFMQTRGLKTSRPGAFQHESGWNPDRHSQRTSKIGTTRAPINQALIPGLRCRHAACCPEVSVLSTGSAVPSMVSPAWFVLNHAVTAPAAISDSPKARPSINSPNRVMKGASRSAAVMPKVRAKKFLIDFMACPFQISLFGKDIGPGTVTCLAPDLQGNRGNLPGI